MKTYHYRVYFDGEKYIPQQRCMFIWTPWTNLKDESEVSFGTNDEAIKFIEQEKKNVQTWRESLKRPIKPKPSPKVVYETTFKCD